MQIDELYPTITKNKKAHAEILDCGHATYTVNTLEFEYVDPYTPTATHILNMVV